MTNSTNSYSENLYRSIPKMPQRQDSTTDQLNDLKWFANQLGMYDAADIIEVILANEGDQNV